MARKRNTIQPKPADPELLARCVAKAVADGDIVNLHQIFAPLSPARAETLESLDDPKYWFLRPAGDEEQDAAFQEALALTREPAIWSHVETELAAKRPPRLPWELVKMLGDRALTLGKPSSAAQAYELLRVREPMKEEFFRLAEQALESEDITKAAKACLIGLGLGYDYAAFPEPGPALANFAKRALVLHAEYPRNPQEVLAFRPPEEFISTGLTYLFDDADLEERLHGQSQERRTALFCELVRLRDPGWDEFVARYIEASKVLQRINERLQALAEETGEMEGVLQDMLDELGEDPRAVPEALLGRALPAGEWWQYLKEIVVQHPPAAMFVGRMMIGDTEVIVPRMRKDSPILARLGLDKALPEPAAEISA